ncbi:TetR/AcrR family transcriptional regulator [Nocardioides sp. CN2-186]|uniref:TetR/AcrR family transcriptional regulator n=1 Tax=Nocardioides tweenelious TaxID=3156607 RepID=UPI0032B4B335
MTDQQGPRRGRGRPRTPGAEQKILAAALSEYAERGWSGFTMDAVARRAGVGKSTVYLRWADKDALLTEAVSTSAQAIALPDSGTLRDDIAEVVHSTMRHFHSDHGWATIRVTFDHASTSEEMGQFAEMVTMVHGSKVRQICDRAVERGELSSDMPPGLVSEMIFGAALINALSERLEGRTDADADLVERADRMIDIIVRGIAASD